LKEALISIRSALEYQGDAHPAGLPAMLLAQLPKELVDVLILLAFKRGVSNQWDAHKEMLCAFVLHWLFFVHNNYKAASMVYQQVTRDERKDGASAGNWVFSRESIRQLIRDLEKEGVAYAAPAIGEIPKLMDQVEAQGHMLCTWEERFTASDIETHRKPGDSLRVLSTNPTLIRRILLWLQRDYIASKFPGYDPTSDRDDDLPIDLDHLIPQDLFGFNWKGVGARLDTDVTEDNDISDNFWRFRYTVGNSLGNYRWLSSTENRGRQKGPIQVLPNDGDLISNATEWNDLIRTQEEGNKWSKKHIAAFQRLIDLRTLDLIKKLLIETGIERLLQEKHP
jgi:hypothetical protein